VSEDRLLENLKQSLAGDFVPLKPLRESWKRALWIFPIALLLTGVTWTVFHLRPDYANFGAIEFWPFYVLQVLAGYWTLFVSLEMGIPGCLKPPVVLAGIGLTGPVIHLIASWSAFRISPSWAAPGREWVTGAACISAIGIFGGLVLLFGFFLARAGLPIHAGTAGLLLGLGSGLAAEAAWRVHCPITSLNHVLPFHTGAILALIAAGLIIGFRWQRSKLVSG